MLVAFLELQDTLIFSRWKEQEKQTKSREKAKMVLLGQIQRMRLFGACCPCIERETDQLFRLADLSLQLVPVLWFRKIKHHTKKPNGGNGTSSYLCGASDYLCIGGTGYDDMVDDDTKKAKDGGEDDDTTPLPQQVLYSPYVPINATLSVVDTAWYGPALQVSSNQFVFADDDVKVSNQPSLESGVIGNISDKVIMKKVIPLSEIDSATSASKDECLAMGIDGAEDFCVVLKSKHNTQTKLLVFHVIPPGHGLDVKKCHTRDQVIDHINMLLTWNTTQINNNNNNKTAKAASVANADIEIVNSAEVGANFVLFDDTKPNDTTATNEADALVVVQQQQQQQHQPKIISTTKDDTSWIKQQKSAEVPTI